MARSFKWRRSRARRSAGHRSSSPTRDARTSRAHDTTRQAQLGAREGTCPSKPSRMPRRCDPTVLFGFPFPARSQLLDSRPRPALYIPNNADSPMCSPVKSAPTSARRQRARPQWAFRLPEPNPDPADYRRRKGLCKQDFRDASRSIRVPSTATQSPSKTRTRASSPARETQRLIPGLDQNPKSTGI